MDQPNANRPNVVVIIYDSREKESMIEYYHLLVKGLNKDLEKDGLDKKFRVFLKCRNPFSENPEEDAEKYEPKLYEFEDGLGCKTEIKMQIPPSTLPVADIWIVTGEWKNNEYEMRVRYIFERKSWEDWLACGTGARVADFRDQIRRMKDPQLVDAVSRHIVITSLPSSGELVTPGLSCLQAELIDSGFKFHTPFTDMGLLDVVRMYVKAITVGYMTKVKPSPIPEGLDPAIMVHLAPKKVEEPKQVLQMMLMSINGVGPGIVSTIMLKHDSIRTLVEALGVGGSKELADLKTPSGRAVSAAVKERIYRGIMGANQDLVDKQNADSFRIMSGVPDDEGEAAGTRPVAHKRKKAKIVF